MSRAAEVELAFAGELRLFRMRIGAQRAVQEKCDCGPMELMRRYGHGEWRVDDLREPLYRGLVDGGMTASEATRLMLTSFDDLPKAQFVPLAQAIVAVGVIGAPDEDDGLGEPGGEAEAATPSPEGKSGSPASTARAPRSGGRRAKSTTSPSGS